MTSVADETKVGDFREVIRIDEDQLKGHVAEVVRQSVEETLNGLLEAEADAICGAGRYERSPERLDTRAGHYTRKLLTQAGAVELQVPRLRKLPLETQIIERYRRRESSVEEALVVSVKMRTLGSELVDSPGSPRGEPGSIATIMPSASVPPLAPVLASVPCPGTVACPISFPRCDATWRPPASTPSDHRGSCRPRGSAGGSPA